MKRFASLSLLICFVCLLTQISVAGEHNKKRQVRYTNLKTLVTKKLRPGHDRPEGSVIVTYEIDGSGTIQVQKADASSEALRNYVIDKLDGEQVRQADATPGPKTLRIAFRSER